MRKGVYAAMLLLAIFVPNPAMPGISEMPATTVAVTVRVRTTGGSPVAQAYVGLIPAWRPSSRPLVEEIAEKGVSVLRVPAGTYWLIAGARGFAVSSLGPVSVSQTSGMNQAIELPALKPATGTVRDEEGHPVTGARVAGVNAAIPPPLGSLSELAVRYLAADLSATTDQNGKWTRKLPEGAVPLLFEAPGRAAEWRIRPENGPAILDVSLSTGATLKVTTDRVDPNLIVTLSREEPNPPTSILADEQPRVWARWTKSNVITWSSLPPGVYGVYAKYPDPRYFMQTAAKLATVTLAAGGQRAVRVALPSVRLPATSSGALFLRGISRKDLGEELQAFGRDTAGNPKLVEYCVEEVIGGSVVYVKTDSVRGPFYGMTKDRFFSTVPDLAEARQDANAEPWPAAVHPRAGAHVHLRFAEKDLQPPRSGVAVLRDCGKGDRVTVPIEVGRDNLARFTAAAGCQSMVLEFEPYEPVVTARVLQPGDQSLGEFLLRGAGSAEVHVVRGPGAALVAGATVRVISDETPGQRSIVVKEAITDDRGWAHLPGLPPYRDLRVIAETPEGDKSDDAALRVEPRERGVVDPLAVPEPAALIVDAKIDETFLVRFPAARVATLFVRPADPDRQSEKRQQDTPKTRDAPLIRFDRLHPGRWLVSGLVSVAGTYSLVDIEGLELKAGETRRLEATIAPNVFEGVVTSEGNGVAAKVIIDDGGQRLNFNSDASGMFRAALQNRGTYRVAVARLSAQGNFIPIGDVAFTDPSRRIEIAIPVGGTVTARVRLGDQPLARTVVWVSRRDDTGMVEQMTNRGGTTDLAGETRFDDLMPGLWTFSVRDQETRRGAEKTATVDGGASITIDLDLASAAAIQGTIRDLGGSPLPRARVECLFVGPTGNPDRASADSDSEGAFSIDLIAPPPPSALCSVIGPMGTVDAFKSIPGQPVEITVPGATAVLQLPDWSEHGNPAMVWLVAPDGRVISLNTVAMTIARFGSPLTIPALAAGRWKVVRVQSLPQWLALADGMGVSLPALADFTLRAGTTETIHLNDIPTHQRVESE
jgi:hypothetical protein